MRLNRLTYVAFLMGCLFLAVSAAQAAPTLSAGAARGLMADSPWIEAAERVIEEKARDGEDSVLITNLPCRKLRALEAAGYELKAFKEGRCLISWAEAEEKPMKEERIQEDPPFIHPEESDKFKLDYLTYRIPR